MLAYIDVVKQATAKKVIKLATVAILVLAYNQSHADQLQDMFSYQASGDAIQNDFIRSNVEGLFEGQNVASKISEQLSFEMVHLKTMHKELDLNHQNTIERNTMIDVKFAKHLFSRIQLGNSQQDIGIFNENIAFNIDNQSMYSLSQGWKGTFGEMSTEGYLGVVRCSDYVDAQYFPVFGVKIGRDFANNSSLKLNVAQEVQGGGSFTGIYGNQIFRKMMVMAKVPLMDKLSFLWDAGIGISSTSYDQNGTRTGVATMSVSLEYALGSSVNGTLGYSHRKLVDLDTGLENAEGHMMSASLAVTSF